MSYETGVYGRFDTIHVNGYWVYQQALLVNTNQKLKWLGISDEEYEKVCNFIIKIRKMKNFK